MHLRLIVDFDKFIPVFILNLILLCSISVDLDSQEIDRAWIESHYAKSEVMIPMRDGIRLYTAIYEPIPDTLSGTCDLSHRPVIMLRTPYSCSPYGSGFSSALWKDMRYFALNRYVIVFQNVRGRYLSEGEFENVRPYISDKKELQTDEASDTYDTAEWLLKNISFNGNIGVTGVSYPGFYATMAALSGHPAIKAVSPQAPILDWYLGDDVHHNGVLMLLDTYSFGGSMFREQDNPTASSPGSAAARFDDSYSFFLGCSDFSGITATFSDTLEFWNMVMSHPDYDSFWKERTPAPYLKDISPAVLVVGGSYDTDDCYGALNTYRILRDKSPDTPLHLVYGPWYHGGWHNTDYSHLGEIPMGEGISGYFMEKIEYPFFRYYLEGKGSRPSPVYSLASGGGKWRTCEAWPSSDTEFRSLYLRAEGNLSFASPVEKSSFTSYVSDPGTPVPFAGGEVLKRHREYMVADQRFAEERSDVLSFSTSVLRDTLKVEGPVTVDFFFETTGTDADLVVKLIDVYPDDQMDGYRMLVRGDVFRTRYRKGYEKPLAARPGKVMRLVFDMDDVAHWFLPGHRLMVQVQSSWFPLTDRNPQKFIPNVYEAEASDYTRAEMTVYHQRNRASSIILPVAE